MTFVSRSNAGRRIKLCSCNSIVNLGIAHLRPNKGERNLLGFVKFILVAYLGYLITRRSTSLKCSFSFFLLSFPAATDAIPWSPELSSCRRRKDFNAGAKMRCDFHVHKNRSLFFFFFFCGVFMRPLIALRHTVFIAPPSSPPPILHKPGQENVQGKGIVQGLDAYMRRN